MVITRVAGVYQEDDPYVAPEQEVEKPIEQPKVVGENQPASNVAEKVKVNVTSTEVVA